MSPGAVLSNVHEWFSGESVSSELSHYPAVPHHVTANHDVFTQSKGRVDEGFTLRAVSVVEICCQEHAAPTDYDNVVLELPVPCIFDVVGHQGHGGQ